MKKFFRIAYYAGITIVFVLVALVGYTQTRSFHNSLQDYILSHYQTFLRGELRIGRLEGNLITGFRLYDVTLSQAGEDVLAAEQVEVTYEPFALFFKRVSVGRLVLLHPRIRLYRSASSGWNVSRLLVPSTDTTTSSWVIAAKSVQFVGAHIDVVDSVLLARRARGESNPPPLGRLDYARVAMDSLDIEGGVHLDAAQSFLQIRSMAFSLQNPRFRLRKLQGDFKLSQREASISNLNVATEESQFSLDAVLSKVNIGAIERLSELKSKPVTVNLRAENLDTRELKEFLYPWVDFLDKSFSVRLYASGELGKLNLHEVAVQTHQSQVVLAGTISNLHRPEDLQLDVSSASSIVDPADVSAHLPGLSLPNLDALGRTRFRLTFQGAPTDFESSIQALTETGSVDVNAKLKIGRILEYRTSFIAHDLDLGRLLKDEELASRINVNGTLTGSGTDPFATSAVARFEVDSSEFWGMPIGQSAFVFDLNNAVLRSHVQLRSRSSLYELSSTLKFPRGDSVSYTLTGNVNSMNLADIIRNPQFKSDLSFTLRGAGTGTVVNRLHHSLAVNFLSSSFGELPFEQGSFTAGLDLRNEQRSYFSFHSDPVDLEVQGRFTLPRLVENVIDGQQMLSDGIAQRFQNLDSLRGSSRGTGPGEFSTLRSRNPKFLDVSYRLNVRNLVPVGVFFQKDFAGSLAMDGKIKGSVDSLDFTGNSRIAAFRYRNRSDTYGFENGTLDLDLQHIARTSPMDALDGRLAANFQRFTLNRHSFYSTSLAVSTRRDSGAYDWSAFIDSTYQVNLRATSLYHSNIYSFEVPQLRVGMDFYIFENSEPATLKLGRGGLSIENFTLAHEVEELGISGYYSPEGRSDLTLTVNDFLLNNLNSVFKKTSLAGPVRDLNGILNATARFKGSLQDPEVAVDVTTNGFRSRSLVFGQIVARSSYANHLLSLFVELRNRQKEQEMKPDLLVSGTVPYDLNLTGGSRSTPEGEINLTMYSKGLNLELLDPFLPAVSNLSGTLICDMRIRGTVDAPAYEGSVTLQGAKFFFDPLGIYYLVQGKLIPRGNRVGLENFVIRNVPQDRTDGQMTLTGTFSLAGLKFEDFDLQADGQLMVMKEASRLAGQKFYGDLFLATGPKGVRWDGQLSNSRVAGDVLIKYGKFIFPPEREAISVAGRAVNVIFRDDTTKEIITPENGRQSESLHPGDQSQYASLRSLPDPIGTVSRSVEPAMETPRTQTETKSFLDNISYDLNIDVQSPTSLRFVFNTQPTEELFADLRGKLAFAKNAAQTRLTGEVTLESRSYYYFFKRFDASGKISFAGDPVNPELDVTAKYEGTHTVDTLMMQPGATPPQTVSGQRLTSERVDVLLQITGTKNKPKTKFSLEFPDRDKNSQFVSKDPDGDAMSFLLTGYLKDELDPQQRGSYSYLTSNMLSNLTSGLISGPLTNALKSQVSTAIQSVDLMLYGADLNKTDVRVTAEISSAVIRFGGRVSEGINNTNVSVEVPVGNVFGLDRWRNLLLKYERKVDAVENIDQRTQSNSLSIFYRFVF